MELWRLFFAKLIFRELSLYFDLKSDFLYYLATRQTVIEWWQKGIFRKVSILFWMEIWNIFSFPAIPGCWRHPASWQGLFPLQLLLRQAEQRPPQAEVSSPCWECCGICQGIDTFSIINQTKQDSSWEVIVIFCQSFNESPKLRQLCLILGCHFDLSLP